MQRNINSKSFSTTAVCGPSSRRRLDLILRNTGAGGAAVGAAAAAAAGTAAAVGLAGAVGVVGAAVAAVAAAAVAAAVHVAAEAPAVGAGAAVLPLLPVPPSAPTEGRGPKAGSITGCPPLVVSPVRQWPSLPARCCRRGGAAHTGAGAPPGRHGRA